MKIKLPKFLKFTKKIRLASLRKTIEIDPFFYWKRILFMMFIVLGVVAIFSILIYYAVNNGLFVDKKSKAEVQALEVTELKDAEIQNLVKMFEDRAAKRAEIINSGVKYQDPSRSKTPVSNPTDVIPETPIN